MLECFEYVESKVRMTFISICKISLYNDKGYIIYIYVHNQQKHHTNILHNNYYNINIISLFSLHQVNKQICIAFHGVPNTSLISTMLRSHTGNEAQTRCFVLSLMQCVPRGWFSSRTTMRYPEVDGQTSWGTDANWWLMLLVPKSMVVLHLYPWNNAWVSEKVRKPTPHSSNEWICCRKHQEAMATQGSLHEGKLVDHEETRNPNLGPFFKWGQLSTADTMFLVGLLWNESWFHVNVVTVCLCTPFILLQTLLKATSFFTVC